MFATIVAGWMGALASRPAIDPSTPPPPDTIGIHLHGLGARAPDRFLIFVAGRVVDAAPAVFYDAARSTVEEHMHAVVVSMEESFVRGGRRFQEELDACRGDDACYQRLAGAVEADLLLVLTAGNVGAQKVIGARLIDLRSAAIIGNAVDPVAPNESPREAIAHRIRGAAPVELWDPYGALALVVNESNAEIALRGRTVGLTPLDRLRGIFPGVYELEVRKAGFKVFATAVTIERNTVTTVDVALEREPDPASWWWWVAIGVAAAGALTGLGVALSPKTNPTLCSAPPGGCDRE